MRFRLRTLLIVMALAAVVSAGFGVNEGLGILAYLVCFLIFVTVLWFKAENRRRLENSQVTGTYYAFDPILGGFTVFGIAIAATVAFCCTGSVTQLTVVGGFLFTKDELKLPAWNIGLLVAIPIGTLAAACVYWIFWPRSYHRPSA
jgi:hypothetical protein